eukprot:864211-Prymnesium_polylepis.1
MVLGSDADEPTALCSRLRSSTAPSESTPASISGASAFTSPPAVRLTKLRTVSSETPLHVPAAAAAPPPWRRMTGRAPGAAFERNAGAL